MSRLEEIKERYEKNKLQTLPLTNEQCKWLINRVEELEKQIIEMTDYMEMLERLNKRAERYKQALEAILTTDDFEDILDYIDRIITIAAEALEGDKP